MLTRCEDCDVCYDDESRHTICPHGPLWGAPDAYCKKHDLVDCQICKEAAQRAQDTARRRSEGAKCGWEIRRRKAQKERPPMNPDKTVNPFEYHKPEPGEIERIEAIRQAYWDCLATINGLVRPGSVSGRYSALARTAMEESAMWATKSVVFERDNAPQPDE